ncbi:hypothetical protein Tco_1469731, partial [Tanacetum coccineum]
KSYYLFDWVVVSGGGGDASGGTGEASRGGGEVACVIGGGVEGVVVGVL